LLDSETDYSLFPATKLYHAKNVKTSANHLISYICL